MAAVVIGPGGSSIDSLFGCWLLVGSAEGITPLGGGDNCAVDAVSIRRNGSRHHRHRLDCQRLLGTGGRWRQAKYPGKVGDARAKDRTERETKHQSQTAATRTIVRIQSVAASRCRSLWVDRYLPIPSLGKLPGQLGQPLLGDSIEYIVGAISSAALFQSFPAAASPRIGPYVPVSRADADIGVQDPLNGGIEIHQSIGLTEKNAVSLRGGHVCLCARCENGLGARMMFVEQTQETEFIRLAWCFEVSEYDVNMDCIEDASRLVFTCCLDDIQACFAQMPSCQCAFERVVLHD